MNPFLQTLLGGFLALAGTAIGPLLQRRHDRWIASREDAQLVRDKAQLLYDELDRVIHESDKATVSAIEQSQGKSAEAIPIPDLGRVRSISALYFPTSLPIIQNFEDNIGKYTSEILEMVSVAFRNADAAEINKLKIKMVANYQNLALDFVKGMREHVNDVLPKLNLK